MSDTGILLFHYAGSIYSHRILWYLALRGIPFSECIQPPYMPRPDMASLGISYRRIPILAINKDVYCDTRIILNRLEEIPGYGPKLGASTPETIALERLLEKWTTDSGVFWEAVKVIPFWNSPRLADPKFIDDRAQLTGKRLVKEELLSGRPGGWAQLRSAFQLLETSILADGRKFVLGDKPSLADIHGIFPLQWVVGIPDSLPEEYFSEKIFPKTFAWIHRFWDAIETAKKDAPKAQTLDGQQAVTKILKGQVSASGKVDGSDPLDARQGEPVEVYINGARPEHRDRGKLVSLDIDEIVLQNEKGVHLHFPRWGFNARKIGDQAGSGSKM